MPYDGHWLYAKLNGRKVLAVHRHLTATVENPDGSRSSFHRLEYSGEWLDVYGEPVAVSVELSPTATDDEWEAQLELCAYIEMLRSVTVSDG